MTENYIFPYDNREISWLKFNYRVLEESEAKSSNPMFERLRFISIFNSNLDEFFMVRVGYLYDLILEMYDKEDYKYNQDPKVVLSEIYRYTKRLIVKADLEYEKLTSELKHSSKPIVNLKADNLNESEREFLKNVFERDIAPKIAPFIIEKKNLFPFWKTQKAIIGAELERKNQRNIYGFIPIDDSLPKIIFLPSKSGRIKYMLIEELLMMYTNKVFRNFTVLDQVAFSVIRNADIEDDGLYRYSKDERDTMIKIIERRYELAPIALRHNSHNKNKVILFLKKSLYLLNGQLLAQKMPISFRFFSALENKLHDVKIYKKLFYPPLVHHNAEGLAANQKLSLDTIAEKKALLLSYPFHDVKIFTDFLDEVADDFRVKSIKITLYRVAKESKVIASLIKAQQNGIDVTCLVELRARFDEENNIDWSKRLEEAGCKVIYGLPDYKVHSKVLLIEYTDEGQEKAVVQIGTGNYNETTSKLYTDMSYFTVDDAVIADAHKIFETLLSHVFIDETKKLLVAPKILKPKILQLINDEAKKAKKGEKARIIFKMNSLTDRNIISALYDASNAGVNITLIIRGICILRSGLSKYSENIKVISIVGRLLEHSRIYLFGHGDNPELYISSADFMTRNTENRVEVAVPIEDSESKQQIVKYLNKQINDNVNVRMMDRRGRYRRVGKKSHIINSQDI